jgi:hypothetical protein
MVEGGGEESLDLGDGQRDQPGLGWRRLVRCARWWRLGIGAVGEVGSGDRADREGGHDQHRMPLDRGVEPRLALVQAEVVLAELEILLHRQRSPAAQISLVLVRICPCGTWQ